MDIVANIRMGMGVVMGSKNLKVVAVRKDIRLFSCLKADEQFKRAILD